jgi:hypothetical protein
MNLASRLVKSAVNCGKKKSAIFISTLNSSSLIVLVIIIYFQDANTYEMFCENLQCRLEYLEIHSPGQLANIKMRNNADAMVSFLTITNSKLTSFPVDIVTSMPILEKIDAEHCQIAYLTPNVFGIINMNSLMRLSHLHLSHNLIQRLPNAKFAGASHLRMLKLSNNRLSIIEKDAFQGLTNLQELFLNENLLQVLDGSWFVNTKSLNSLELQNNEIAEIKSISPSPNLKILNFGSNYITNASEISKFTSLTELVLS